MGNTVVVFDEALAVVQRHYYYPFGLEAQHSSLPDNTYRNRYNGIEKNIELGLETSDAFFRNMDPTIGRWWQSDPKPSYSMSTYSMMGNNPILMTDMLGDTINISFRAGFLGLFGKKQSVNYHNGKLFNTDGSSYTGKYNYFLRKVLNGLSDLKNSTEGDNMIKELENSKNVFNIKFSFTNSFMPNSTMKSSGNLSEVIATTGNRISGGSGGVISWNPWDKNSSLNSEGTTKRPAFIGLGHEIAHARDSNLGYLFPKIDNNNSFLGTSYQSTYLGLFKAEWNAVYSENLIRLQLGIPLRVYYGLSVEGGTYSGNGPMTVRSYKGLIIPTYYPIR